MISPSRTPSRRSWFRSTVAAAVLLLQTAVVLSPLGEPPAQAQIGAHAEEYGARHLGLHNESTCLVCAVRAMHAVPSPAADLPSDFATARRAERTTEGPSPSPAAIRTNRSRAPPTAR